MALPIDSASFDKQLRIVILRYEHNEFNIGVIYPKSFFPISPLLAEIGHLFHSLSACEHLVPAHLMPLLNQNGHIVT